MQGSFSLPASSWEQIKKIIKGYWVAGEKGDSSLKAVAARSTVHHTEISRNNRFLRSIGVISDTKPPDITELGKRLAKALEYEQKEGIQEAIAEAVKESEFLSKILDAVKIRKSMPGSALRNHVALTAGAPKSTKTMQGVNTIIDFLLEGNLLETDGENYSLKGELPKKREEEPKPAFSDFFGFRGLAGAEPAVDSQKAKTVATLQIKLNLTANDIKKNPEDLAKSIKTFINELKKPQKETKSPEEHQEEK